MSIQLIYILTLYLMSHSTHMFTESWCLKPWQHLLVKCLFYPSLPFSVLPQPLWYVHLQLPLYSSSKTLLVLPFSKRVSIFTDICTDNNCKKSSHSSTFIRDIYQANDRTTWKWTASYSNGNRSEDVAREQIAFKSSKIIT